MGKGMRGKRRAIGYLSQNYEVKATILVSDRRDCTVEPIWTDKIVFKSEGKGEIETRNQKR